MQKDNGLISDSLWWAVLNPWSLKGKNSPWDQRRSLSHSELCAAEILLKWKDREELSWSGTGRRGRGASLMLQGAYCVPQGVCRSNLQRSYQPPLPSHMSWDSIKTRLTKGNKCLNKMSLVGIYCVHIIKGIGFWR